MNTAQSVWLACHANARLGSKDWNPSDLDQSIFKHCLSVEFVRYSSKHSAGNDGVLVGANPLEWFEYLAMSGTQRVTLSWRDRNDGLPSHISSAFAGGGGAWVIDTHMDDQTIVSWTSMQRFVEGKRPRFRLFSRSAAEPSGWEYLYTGNPTTYLPEAELTFDHNLLSTYKQKFSSSLMKIARFAREQGLEFWAENFFDRAIAALSKDGVDSDLDISLAPPGVLAMDARQVLCAARRCSVFGGMGSWNDQCVDGPTAEEAYNRLSHELYEAMNKAVAAAASSIGVATE